MGEALTEKEQMMLAEFCGQRYNNKYDYASDSGVSDIMLRLFHLMDAEEWLIISKRYLDTQRESCHQHDINILLCRSVIEDIKKLINKN